ncbi:unnamed protein product [Microthlaspi erraticum]|uniref:F-box domain-containing protein n=1 Tax=Microthlaspi erraticum TaxID=1685480 RepID=A0A6D2KD12_9BRAS|nr:unnamed protein product [Microthlaspi erraticum]
MMSDLPQDLLEEILSRVPAKTLAKTLRRVWSVNVNLNAASSVLGPPLELKGPLSLKEPDSDSQQVDIVGVFHCDGLLLCTTNDNKLVVWNPYFEETMWIQPKTGNMKNSRFALGYVNNKSSRSYKILRCWDDKFSGFEIYDISSGSWRDNKDDNVYVDCFIRANGVSLKGNTYWLATEETNKSCEFLLCFDFTRERFRLVKLPTFCDRGYMGLSVVGEETLSVLERRSFTSKMKMMWVANITDSESVKVLLSISDGVDLHIPDPCFPVYATCLIDKKEKKVAACCNASFETSKTMENIIGEGDGSTNNSGWSPFVFNYVPSLVQIPSHRSSLRVLLSRKMTMVMSDLPQDVVEEILSRVSAKSLKRLRSTCKLWNSLFTDKGFTEKHFRVAPKQSLVLMLKE